MINTPMIVPNILPDPPVIEVPPITVAAMAFVSIPEPEPGSIAV